MIENKDIRSVRFVFDRIDAQKNEKVDTGSYELEVKLNLGWSMQSLRKDGKSARYKIIYGAEATLFNIKTESTFRIHFNRETTIDEAKSEESQKECLFRCVPYLIQGVSELAIRMGFSPLLFEKSLLEGMIKNTKIS